jgi:1-acyl-sn-glycerol-3-phosphate acyltransferase
MPASLKLAIGLTRLTLNVLVGLLIAALYFPFAGQARRERLICWWARGVLRICGIDLRLEGPVPDPSEQAGLMLLANHVSWLDIYVLNAVVATRFVAKSEIRGWPVFGYLARRTGTLFIERGRRHAVHRANADIAAALRQGARVGVFPEGTTGDGRVLLPFHANLIQAAVDAPAVLQPVALRYETLTGQPCMAVAFVGDMTLLASICSTLRAAPLCVLVRYLARIDAAGVSRHALARQAGVEIALSLGVDAPGSRPETAPGLPVARH